MYINDITTAIVLLLAGIGASQLLFVAASWLVRPRHAPGDIFILPVRGEVENIEQILRYYESRLHQDFRDKMSRVIILDLGASDGTLEVCRRLCDGRSDMVLCRPEQILSAIE